MQARLCVLVVGHGSRETNSNREFESLVRDYGQYRPDLEIHWSYTELALPETKVILQKLAEQHKKIVLLPLFLFTSGHIKNDLPLILAELRPLYPQTEFVVCQTLGVHPKITEILLQRAQSTLPQTKEEQSQTGVILVSRGSSDPDANSDFHKAARLFQESSGYAFVQPSFIGITTPLLPQSLETAAKLRPQELLVIPYFLFGGRLIQRIEKIVADFSQNYPWIKVRLANYFGTDPLLFSLLDEKIQDALSGGLALPCVSCEYRQQLPNLPSKVGGLQALLWSIRHRETHNQAVPHEFPHRNLKKHILICENVDCASRGSGALISQMRSLIKDHGRQADFRITRTSCMGRCGEGPAVVVYPDGIWYQNVQASDAVELVENHLFQDRIVSRLVDNIMQ